MYLRASLHLPGKVKHAGRSREECPKWEALSQETNAREGSCEKRRIANSLRATELIKVQDASIVEVPAILKT